MSRANPSKPSPVLGSFLIPPTVFPMRPSQGGLRDKVANPPYPALYQASSKPFTNAGI